MLPRSTTRSTAARCARAWPRPSYRAWSPRCSQRCPAPRRTPPTRSRPATSPGSASTSATPQPGGDERLVKSSPFRAAGIYISGNSRACRTQNNLTPTWVRNQLAAGWHLMPITLGPQASCSTRYPRYGKNIDPTINPSTASNYSAARARARAEARKAVSTALRLGIVRGSTIFYDLEAFNTRSSTACTTSAKWFIIVDDPAARTRVRLGLLLQRRVRHQDARRRAGRCRQPVHPARPGLDRRLEQQGRHQLLLHPQRRLAALRPRQAVPGRAQRDLGRRDDQHRPQLPQPADTEAARSAPPLLRRRRSPKYTGSATKDARCTPASISKARYRKTDARTNAGLYVPLQCLLKQQQPVPLRGHRAGGTSRLSPRCTPSSAGPATRCGPTSPATSGPRCSPRATATPACVPGSGAPTSRGAASTQRRRDPAAQGQRHVRRRHSTRRRRLPASSRGQGLWHRRPAHLGRLREGRALSGREPAQADCRERDDAGEEPEPVGAGTAEVLDGVLGVRHQARRRCRPRW